MKKISIWLFTCLLISSFSLAQNPRSPIAKKATANAPVINFEDELIEGERVRPDLLFQTGGPPASIDEIIYKRKDFNDFLTIDQKKRPTYVPPTKGQ